MYTSKQIADWILSKINIESGDTISPLKLQKLLYYCQAWHLTVFKTPLFEERIEAWAHGPVIPSQYSRFAFMLRNDHIKIKSINLDVPTMSEEIESLLNEVLDLYGEHSANYLEQLTHSEKPWINAREGIEPWRASSNEITRDSMIAFYSSFLNSNNGE